MELPSTVCLDPDKRRVPILANARAGTGKSHRLVNQLVGRLRHQGFDPILCWQREALSELCERSDRDNVRCVIAAGGDGTLLEVLNRAQDLPVALLPLGNENLVAKFCGADRSSDQTAQSVVTGNLRKLDLGQLNGRLFCLHAGFGLDADVVHRVHHKRRGHINKLSYIVPILQTFSNYMYPPIDVEIEDTGEKLRGRLVFVFNVPRYGLGLPLAEGASPDDGLLDVYVFERPGIFNVFRYLFATVLHRQKSLPDYQHRVARQVRVSSRATVPVQIDGDPSGFLPATLEIVPRALTLVVPT